MYGHELDAYADTTIISSFQEKAPIGHSVRACNMRSGSAPRDRMFQVTGKIEKNDSITSSISGILL